MRAFVLALLALCLTSLCGAQSDSHGTGSDEAGYMEQEYGFTRDNLDARLKYVLDVASPSVDEVSFQSLPSSKTALNGLVEDVKEGGIMYIPSGYYSLDQPLYIGKNLTLRGDDLVVIDAKNDHLILDIGKGLDVHIENITFINGRGDYGGAIHAKAGDLSLEGCTFYKNAAYQGAGLYSDGGNTSINRCKVIDNVAVNGIIALPYGGRLVLENTEFGGNVAALASNSLFFIDYSSQVPRASRNQSNFHQKALNTLGGYSKGIYSNDLDLVINRCSFHDNAAKGNGEATSDIVAVGNILVANSDFRSNSGDSYGGAISVGGDLVVVTDTDVVNNTIAVWGPSAGISIYGGNALIHRCSISGNHNATGGLAECGGVMVEENASIEILDSTITGNIGYTGGIYIKPGATVSIGDCNISGNTASNKGGAIYSEGAMSLKGCSIAKNIPDDIHCN